MTTHASSIEDWAANSASIPSFAEQMQQQHAEVHKPTVEDAIDEEDLAHPPPSGLPVPIPEPAEPLSAKAAGKQKAKEEDASIVNKSATLDTKNEELFPALGGGPKAKAPGSVSTAWGAKKPAAVANGNVNDTNGYDSRPSTPGSGILTPTSTNMSMRARNNGPQQMSMPGKHTERIPLAPSQLLPRGELRKPLQDVLRDINKRSKAKVTKSEGQGGMIIFEGIGPRDAVRQALKDVAKEVGSKQTVQVQCPISVRPHIIGRQGATVQGITKRTGARIQVPNYEKNAGQHEEDDDSAVIDISIEGDAVAAEMARREIDAIINERTSTTNMRLRDVPPEFYPFLAGPRNRGIDTLQAGRDIKVKIPQYHSWSHQPPPQANDPPVFVPHPTNHIQLSGDRQAVQDARQEIERQVEQLRRHITLSQLAINKGQHQFIIGDRGTSLDDILAETGCAVILPPDSEDTEMITITGPHDRIEHGIDRVMNLAASMQSSIIDVARQHSNAPSGPQSHARALTRYLQQRQAIAQLEQMHDSHIVLPTMDNGPTTWEVYSRDGKNAIRARSDIVNLINAHPPSRLRHVDVDPFFYPHLANGHHNNVRQAHGVHMVIPSESDSDSQVVLVYEGPMSADQTFQPPRQRPTPSEVAQFEQALQEAEDYIMKLVNEQGRIGTQDMQIPSKYHDKTRKFVNRQQQDLSDGILPVQFRTTPPQGTNERKNLPQATSSAVPEHNVQLRGPVDRLDPFVEQILAFVEDEKRDEAERGFTMSFDFPQKYANFLIGKKGENINKLREEFDVEINVNEGKVDLRGPKAKAEAAKSRILTMAKKWEDEATHILKIKPQYHRELIGAKGSQVNRLQDRYSVRVQFPRSTPTANEDESMADGASEMGARNVRSNQAPDEVIIRGPKKGADEAREELLNLLQYTIDTSHNAVVSVAQSQLPSLIGQGGREMENVREKTGAKIDIPGSREAADPSGRVELKIKGSKKQVEDAKRLLEEKSKAYDSTVTRALNVDKKYHKALIGSGGSNIRTLVVQAGGSDDRRELARTVRFPRSDSDESTIRIEGTQAIVENIVAAIRSFVDQRENQITETVDVAPEKHRLLIGHGGETRRNLESKFEVSIDIPKQSVQGAARSHIKVAGLLDNVQKAKAHILEMVKEQEGETVQVPRAAHHIISDNGQFFRRLRNDHKVTVDHAGQQPPTKSAAAPRPRVNNGAALPLITDDQNDADNFSWEVVDQSSELAEAGDIPWVLRGSPENIAKARTALDKALHQAQQHPTTGYLILPDPKTYRFVIGQGGSQINTIRRQTGCKINVPRDQARGEAIEIVGSKEGVEQAKDIILEIVKKGGSNGNGRSRRDSE